MNRFLIDLMKRTLTISLDNGFATFFTALESAVNK